MSWAYILLQRRMKNVSLFDIGLMDCVFAERVS